jgi:hypothetical protein
MVAKKRVKIPQGISDSIMFESDRTCCICQKSGLAVHTHHIDENPTNNSLENLVVLCLEDHAQVSTKQTMGKGISHSLLKKYKVEWCAVVRSRREALLVKPKASLGEVNTYLEALACHEIRKATLNTDMKKWGDIECSLMLVAPYPESWMYGDAVRHEVLNFLKSVACATRHGMPNIVATQVSHIAIVSLPIVSLVVKARHLPKKSQIQLFQTAIDIGFSMAHDGVKYLKNFKVTMAGLDLLNKTLRYAHLNNLSSIKKEALNNFEHFLEVASNTGDKKAIEWGVFERDDALALEGDSLPRMPR